MKFRVIASALLVVVCVGLFFVFSETGQTNNEAPASVQQSNEDQSFKSFKID